MKAIGKFLAVFIALLVVLCVVVPMFTHIQLNTMMALLFAGISALAGFFVILNHHRIVKGKHACFVIGIIMMFAAGGLLYGSISVPMKTELYWNMTPQLMTFLVIIFIAGFAVTVIGFKSMVSRN